MEWDSRRRVYVRDDGSIVSPKELHQMIENYIDQEKEEIGREADAMIAAGASTVAIAAFFEFMRAKVSEIHGAAALTAYGGESEMTPERWARVGTKIASENNYLAGFEQAVKDAREATDNLIREVSRQFPSVQPATIEQVILTNPPSELPQALNKLALDLAGSPIIETVTDGVSNIPKFDSLIWGEVGSRSRMYADSTYGTYENSQRARESDVGVLFGRRVAEEDSHTCDDCSTWASPDWQPLDELPDIGSGQCLSNCRCTIEFNYHDIGPISIDRSAYAE